MLEENPVPTEVTAASSEVCNAVTAEETAVLSRAVPLVIAVCLAVVIAVLKVWRAVRTDLLAVCRLVPVTVPVGASLRRAERDCEAAACS